jgi:hypothetical protein
VASRPQPVFLICGNDNRSNGQFEPQEQDMLKMRSAGMNRVVRSIDLESGQRKHNESGKVRNENRTNHNESRMNPQRIQKESTRRTKRITTKTEEQKEKQWVFVA